jgi:hypothetical protein
MTEAGRSRLLAILVLIAFVGFVGVFLSVPWLISDPLPVVNRGERVTFPAADAPSHRVAAQLRVNASGEFEFLIRLPSEGRQASPPRVVFDMPGHDMGAVDSAVRQIGSRDYLATGRLEMAGQWQVRIEDNANSHLFDFILAEY